MTNNEKEAWNMCNRTLTLLGMATVLLMECRNSRPRADHYKFDWFMDAINAVVYEDKPIPSMPEKGLL